MLEFDGNVMIYGLPLIGKTILARNIFLSKLKEGYGGVYITTNDTGEDVLDWFKDFDVNFKVIDCISKTIYPDSADTEFIKRVASPIDLTGISVWTSRFLDSYFRSGKRDVIILLDSLSTLLMYTNPQTVYRFLHVVTRRIRATKAKALYIVQKDMHEERTITTLKHMFDGVIEVKEESNKRFLRFISSTQKTDWIEFSIDGKTVVI